MKIQLRREERQAVIDSIKINNIVQDEFMKFFLGDFLGSGISRVVFDYNPDKRYVIKIDVSEYNANVLEFHNWQDVKETKEAKWFAPVLRMSTCGRILIQAKCKPISKTEDLPKKMPMFLSDIKQDNFGYIKNQLVCFDYAWLNRDLNNKLRTVLW